MLIYNGLKTDFMADTENDVLETKLYDAIKNKMNRSTGLSELNSWRNSLKEMYITLNDSNIPSDVGVAIEYNIPQTSKRVDFLISGYDKDNKGNVIIIELKQWEKLQAVEGQDAIVETYTGGANRRVVHPSYQAWSYAALIKDYNEYVQDAEIELHPCAYLHNYPRTENDPLDAMQYEEILTDAPAFTYGQRELLRKFIKDNITTGDNEDTLVKIEHGKIRPSKQLQDSISSMLKGNKEFIMLDEQKVVYENTKLNEDVVAVLCEDGILVVVIMMIREGRLIDKKDFTYFVDDIDKTEYFETFFRDYYTSLKLEYPDKIVSKDLEEIGNKELYQDWLKVVSGKKITINYGNGKGKYGELYELALKNARNTLENAKLKKMAQIRDDFNEVGSYLAEKLKLTNFPNRIECYDISHIQGTNTVASMVVFQNGLPKKTAYRKFKVRMTEGKPDDFLSMKEVLSRRLARLGEPKWEKPDLIIIDGGKGQLSSVMQIVEEMGIKVGKGGIDFVSLAKREEEVFLPRESKSIILPRNSNALYLIQRIRDEAHRFAITYHRDLRSKSAIKQGS